MTNGISGGIYGTIDADFTPVMFDQDISLDGEETSMNKRLNKYELTIK